MQIQNVFYCVLLIVITNIL